MSDAPVDEDLRSFTSWKLDVMDAASTDPDMSASEFRTFFRVLQYANRYTREAIVSDETLTFDRVGSRTTLFKNRTSIKGLGYWDYDEGRYGRATIYRFNEDKINARLDQRIVEKERRKEERDRAKSKRVSVRKTEHRTSRASVRKAEHREGSNVQKDEHYDVGLSVQITKRYDAHQCSKIGTDSVRKSEPLHLRDTPSPVRLPEENLTVRGLPHAPTRETHSLDDDDLAPPPIKDASPVVLSQKQSLAEACAAIEYALGMFDGPVVRRKLGEERFTVLAEPLTKRAFTSSDLATIRTEANQLTGASA